MLAILPLALLADDVAAMLHTTGVGVLVNKYPAPESIALFSNDLIETQNTASARINVVGSTADIRPETMIQFESDELALDHGSLSVNTSRGLRVRVGCLIVTPVNNAEWTQYDVVDVNGKVTVSALKNDVNIDARSNSPQQAKASANSDRVTVREGEQKSRDERCGAADIKTKPGGRLAGVGAIMNSPWAIGAGLVGIGGLCLGVFCRGDDPMSPAKP